MNDVALTDLSEEAFLEQLKREFLKEAWSLLEECDEAFLGFESEANREEELKRVFRIFHSLKGSGMSVGFTDLSELAHKAEDVLAVLRLQPAKLTQDIQSLLLTVGDALKVIVKMLEKGEKESLDVNSLKLQLATVASRLKDGETSSTTAVLPQQPEVASSSPAGPQHQERSTTVKIDVERVESILDLVGELMVIKSQLSHHTSILSSDDRSLRAIVNLLDKTVRELQDQSLGMRMMPLKGLFLKVQRTTRDLSIKLSKAVNFVMEGEETELDRRIVESLADPLIHLARNAIDHGIETTLDRVKSGKGDRATVTLSARASSGRVIIEIRDDGRGISRKKVFDKAKSNGLLPPNTTIESMTDNDIYALLFKAGFSTAEKVTDVSGRGVGLDVVKSNVEKLKGLIEIHSQEGQGSRFCLSFPLTTAIADGLMLKVCSQSFVMPISSVREIVKVNRNDISTLSGDRSLLDVRGRMLPIFSIGSLLFGELNQFASMTAIVVQYGESQISLACDEVVGQTQVVQKSLGDTFEELKGVAGGAILSDGNVALVLDVDGLCEVAGGSANAREAA
jgi:two-component system chemotaxis sensor kinase CheA